MGINEHRKYVALARAPQTTNDSDGYWEPLNPANAWCSIQPAFGQGDGRITEHLIEMRFHAQVTVDTRIVYTDPVLSRDRQFFVRGVQNIDEANDLIRLACEETAP